MKDRLLAALPGRPFNDIKWPDIIRRVQLAMERANAALRLPVGNRRGRYRSVAVGVSLGNGSKACHVYLSGAFPHEYLVASWHVVSGGVEPSCIGGINDGS